jgi:cell division protein FtsL
VFLVASFVLFGVLVVGVASLQAVVAQGSFRMQDLTRRNQQLEQEYGRLKLEVAELSAPGRIAARARRMGFHVPQPGNVSALRVKGGAHRNAGAGPLMAPAVSLRSMLEARP